MSTRPRCIRWPPVLSGMTRCATPCWPSSQAVSEAPWLRGRVSSTQTWTGAALACAAWIGAGVAGGGPVGIEVGEDLDGLAGLLPRRDILDQREAVAADRLVDGDIFRA